MSDVDKPTPNFSAVKKRQETFAEKTTTKLWYEEPSQDNPYIAEACLCHGYDLLELMSKRSYVDVLYLLFRGDLPTAHQKQLLEQLLIAFINPGPRHTATRAAMNAGIGKTDTTLVLPISLSVFGGSAGAAGEVEEALRWLRKHCKQPAASVAQQVLTEKPTSLEGDWSAAPGFGSHYGGVDQLTLTLAQRLAALPGAGDLLTWGGELAAELTPAQAGWLPSGVVAAALGDLGFQPRMTPGIFQLIAAPGLFAHGHEMAPKPVTAMPFPDDDHYEIEYLTETNHRD